MLKQRIITAIVLVAAIGSGIVLLPPLGLALLFTVLVLIAAWEWAAMAGLENTLSRAAYVVSTALLMLVTVWYCQLLSQPYAELALRDVLGLGCLWWAFALLWVRAYPAGAGIWGSVAVRMLMGFLTLLPAWLALIYLRMHEQGVGLIFVLLALVAAADIGAYFTGRAWGRAKLAPAVSPGKSWAGFWGGVSSSCLLAVLFWLQWGSEAMSLPAVVAVALATALASVLGDLLESMVKRHRGIKDSGTILPGHGGMMDRIDSITAAAPVFALSLFLAGW